MYNIHNLCTQTTEYDAMRIESILNLQLFFQIFDAIHNTLNYKINCFVLNYFFLLKKSKYLNNEMTYSLK
jgi:hypothetical protein